MQAQVPTTARAQPLGNTLLFQPDASVDSVVLLNTLSAVTDIPGFCRWDAVHVVGGRGVGWNGGGG